MPKPDRPRILLRTVALLADHHDHKVLEVHVTWKDPDHPVHHVRLSNGEEHQVLNTDLFHLSELDKAQDAVRIEASKAYFKKFDKLTKGLNELRELDFATKPRFAPRMTFIDLAQQLAHRADITRPLPVRLRDVKVTCDVDMLRKVINDGVLVKDTPAERNVARAFHMLGGHGMTVPLNESLRASVAALLEDAARFVEDEAAKLKRRKSK